jgi:hypothetical protein
MTAATAEAVERRPIPKIKPWSWLGVESLAWGFVIGHVIKWAVDCWYFIISQLTWSFSYPKQHVTVNYWNLTDIWDHLPYWTGHLLNNMGIRTSWTAWLLLASTDNGWDEPRHLARGVIIGLVSGVIVQMLFAKPTQYTDDDVSAWAYVFALPKSLLYAVPGCAVVGVLAYFLPWLTQHGWQVPGNNLVSNEINQWVSAGTWIGIAMGIAGSFLFARYAARRPAQEAQWFYAERSAGKIRSQTGLGKLRGTRVIGTPTHRVRVHWLLDNAIECAVRSSWSVRLLLGAMFLTLLSAGGGAYIALAGPAAGAH